MTGPMRRRTLLAAGPLVLAGCRAGEGVYFGKTEPPKRQRLVVLLGAEPGSLDPATSTDLVEDRVIYALFEGLTTLHPQNSEPMAGLATHYESPPGASNRQRHTRARCEYRAGSSPSFELPQNVLR